MIYIETKISKFIMAKIARFTEYINEDSKVEPLKDVEWINLRDAKVTSIIKFKAENHYIYKGVNITFSKSTASHLEEERLRYSAVFGYGNYDNDGSPMSFDWVVYGKTPEDVVKELIRMIPEYIEANPKPKKPVTKPVKESTSDDSDHEDDWRQLTKDEKIERLMKKLDDAAKKKKLKDVDIDKLRERMDKEIQKSGPDKIRKELMRRAKEDEDIKNNADGDSGRIDKAKELVKQEVWKGYKQPVGQFFDTMYDIMAG